ncbi:MerR family transcriptional regulator [Propioniciclava sp. MC1595]|uniref:transcriptional regulator FtsR n=1 Tax=Propioniciclava sp. MC1595 TaxID=2760308 RepID=UPI0016624C56|nr:MerR family transcriptional regulator [Propioniciclava sp. MC1595]MBB1495929.1 MerR family transcriptional regulator [Propioniciclava sp. MC1595]QTE27487.1 MerR family transcriptional regulator [Propioniciclava sp. MC1595]
MPPATKSIGQVLKVLKEDFPDISISKIRFLEGEGLISPERAPSGYRRYSDHDVKRLHYILDVQKNHYLPLKVIRENLEAMDAGEQPPAAAPSQPTLPTPVAEGLPPALPPQRPAIAGKRTIHITRKELLQISGLTEVTLSELEQHGLVTPRRGTAYYGRDALTIAVAARKLAAYGMDARHLRAIKQVAEREAALIDQAVQAHSRRRSTPRQSVAEVMQLVMYAHAALLRSSIRS